MSSYFDSLATRGLIFLNVLLVVVFAARLLLPNPEPALPAGKAKASAHTPSAPSAEQVPVASIENYPTIVERPLFIEARRAADSQMAAASAAVTASANSLNGLSLAGIVLVGNRRIALVKAPGAAEALRVGEGDDVHGWQVLRVEREAVVLSNNNKEQTLAFPKSVQGVTVVTPQSTAITPQPRPKPTP